MNRRDLTRLAVVNNNQQQLHNRSMNDLHLLEPQTRALCRPAQALAVSAGGGELFPIR